MESLFLDCTNDGDYLVFYVRAENLQRSNEVFTHSNHPVDVATRAFIGECWDLENSKLLEPVYDVDRISEIAMKA